MLNTFTGSRFIPSLNLSSGTGTFAGQYTSEEKKHFMDYIDQHLARIELPNKDMPFLREKILLMYANPLTNYLATQTDNPK